MDVAIATCADFPLLGPYDRGVLDALAQLRLTATPLVWTDPEAPWDRAKVVVIQSTWDSHRFPTQFLAWADRVENVSRLFNPALILRWNLHKFYLRDLEARGLPITPTVWVERGSSLQLEGVLRTRGWDRAVIKPAISADADGVYVVDRTNLSEAQHRLNELSLFDDALVQPYLDAFETQGERSYVFIDGAFSHAIRRPPTLPSAPRSFSDPELLTACDTAEVRLAASTIKAAGENLLYARVDLVNSPDGRVRIQELELTEPCLFSSLAAGAHVRIAKAIAARL